MSDLDAIALQFKAEEHHDAAAAAARVEEFVGATSPEAPEPSPEQQKAAEEKAQLAALEEVIKGQLPKVCAIAWGLIDGMAVKYAGPQYAQTPEERAALAEATVPVVLKYLPKDLTWLANTPEGALLLTAGTIYAFKLLAPAPAPAPELAAAPTTAPPGPSA